MIRFIRETLALLEIAALYPVGVLLYGKEKARKVRSRRIDRALGYTVQD